MENILNHLEPGLKTVAALRETAVQDLKIDLEPILNRSPDHIARKTVGATAFPP